MSDILSEFYWYSRTKDFVKLHKTHLQLIDNYFKKLSIDDKTKSFLTDHISTFYNVFLLIKKIKERKINIDEITRNLSNANETILSSSKIIEDDCGMAVIEVLKRNNKLIRDLISLKNEKITVNNFYETLEKYTNLNKVVVMCFFNQQISVKVVCAELVNFVVAILTSKNGSAIQNNKNTKITANTRKLVEDIFAIDENGRTQDNVKISDRELSRYKNTNYTGTLLYSLYP